MITLGDSKAITPRDGDGLRWLKIRQPRLSPKAPLTVAYSIWRTSGTSYLCGVHVTVRDDNREAAARVVRDARRREFVERRDVGPAQVVDVHVVAQARTVGRRVVGAEDREFLDAPLRRPDAK